MLNPVGRAGTAIITPLLKAADSASATHNWSSLDRALNSAGLFNGTVKLPAGPFYLENASAAALNLDENRAFITVQGAGRDKTLLIPTGTNALGPLNIASALVGYTKDGTFTIGTSTITLTNAADQSKYDGGDVVYFWKRPSAPTNTRPVRQRIVVLGVSGTNVITLSSTIAGSPDPDDFKHIKGHAVDGTATDHSAVPVGATSVVMLDSSFESQFVIGDDVLIGDGPGINELRGEWVRVTGTATASGKTTISFTPPLQQAYDADLTCIVPGRLNTLTGRRQHLTDILFRNLSICAPTSGTYVGQFGIVRAAVRIRFENVGFIMSPLPTPTSLPTLKQMAFATCGDVTIRDGFYDGQLILGPAQNATVDNVVAGSILVNEFSLGCRFSNTTTTGTGGFTLGNGLGQRIHLSDCVIRNYVDDTNTPHVAFAKDSVISNVQITHPGTTPPPGITLDQNGLILTNVTSDSSIKLSGTGLRVENLTCPDLELLSGSSGVLITPPSVVTDNSTAGSWGGGPCRGRNAHFWRKLAN